MSTDQRRSESEKALQRLRAALRDLETAAAQYGASVRYTALVPGVLSDSDAGIGDGAGPSVVATGEVPAEPDVKLRFGAAAEGALGRSNDGDGHRAATAADRMGGRTPTRSTPQSANAVGGPLNKEDGGRGPSAEDRAGKSEVARPAPASASAGRDRSIAGSGGPTPRAQDAPTTTKAAAPSAKAQTDRSRDEERGRGPIAEERSANATATGSPQASATGSDSPTTDKDRGAAPVADKTPPLTERPPTSVTAGADLLRKDGVGPRPTSDDGAGRAMITGVPPASPKSAINWSSDYDGGPAAIFESMAGSVGAQEIHHPSRAGTRNLYKTTSSRLLAIIGVAWGWLTRRWRRR